MLWLKSANLSISFGQFTDICFHFNYFFQSGPVKFFVLNYLAVNKGKNSVFALKAGMVDLDGLKLADLSGVKLNEAGEVEGAEALMEALKKSKPYLFGAPSSSTPGTPPSPKTPEAKKATEMTDEEYQQAKAALLRGGRR